MEKKPLVVLAGPTAVGKTSLSVQLAERIGAEIISADSMQVYRGMDIGSAKITPEEMKGIPHFLLDILEPDEDFNVVLFQQFAKKALEQIYAKGKIPMIVGGTGFYIQALLYDIDFTENADDGSYRAMLGKKANNGEKEILHKMLQECDPRSAGQIHPNNTKRVIRALEYYHQTGRRISDHNEEEHKKESPYNYAYFVLTEERTRLYEKIDRRVDLMMEQGLLNEVRMLKEHGVPQNATSMQGLGYKELYAHLDGEYTLDEAVRIIKRDTRHFAKRQLTWFRRERNIIWLDRAEIGQSEDEMMDRILNSLRLKKII